MSEKRLDVSLDEGFLTHSEPRAHDKHRSKNPAALLLLTKLANGLSAPTGVIHSRVLNSCCQSRLRTRWSAAPKTDRNTPIIVKQPKNRLSLSLVHRRLLLNQQQIEKDKRPDIASFVRQGATLIDAYCSALVSFASNGASEDPIMSFNLEIGIHSFWIASEPGAR